MLEKAGREKRRKKQAVRHFTFFFFENNFKHPQVRRMEQIIRSHNASEEPEGMQTLDRDQESERADSRSREEGRRRQHKRSILKQEGRRGKDESSLLHETSSSSVRTKGGNKEAKVKFAGSLQRRGGGGRNERNRRLVVRGPTYLLQLPWGYQPVSQPHHLYELQLHQHQRL